MAALKGCIINCGGLSIFIKCGILHILLLKLVSVAYFTAIDIETVMKSVMFLYYNVNITVKNW